MSTLKRLIGTTLLISLTAGLFAGCAAPIPDHVYVVDYQVIGDRTVKYIYIPGEESQAGQMFLDQSVALEICSVRGVEEARADAEESIERDCRTTRILRTQEFR